ncbi:cobalt-precorrin-6A reductase [Allobranchiibius sp. CTAmp26]|uniref:cobalt-precorrin-6A reductase n=1 Tax=Allobranchiibius sp. CTAmp26 TaxID=2815214 RepID=UPI001AA159A0|nr:cobalt-precorrin-6A reductase [Allobranchiibius sp. CTAmp26]MBO1756778.1 cobalt-precorrin-6A reductase [Allobranchiibius sp. CTAmp26]
MFVLILGGTAEARDLAARLHGAGVPFASSLAGRVARPRLPVGQVRIGGFGGVVGLAAYLRSSEVTHLVDATHPFAATMTRHAAQAAADVGISLIRLARPGWSGRPDAPGWHWCGSLSDVCRVAGGIGARPFLTSGRQTLPAFAAWSDRDVLVRVVEPVQQALPARWTVVQDRGPYDVDGELALLRDHRIDVLVTKDSGGDYTSAKLDAAAALGVPVVVLSRPSSPAGLREVSSVDGCLALLPG